MKNHLSELECQITEKDAIINFLSNELVNKNLNGDSRVNKTVNDHKNSFQERTDNIVNNILPLVKHKVSVSNFPGGTSKDILDEVEDTLKTQPDTLIVHAGTNDLTKNINTLRPIKKLCEKAKRVSPDTKIVFSNMIYRKDRRNTDMQRINTN